MVQIIKKPESFGDKFLESFRRTADYYTEQKKAQADRAELSRFADPNTPDIEKSRILAKHGKIGDLVKFDKQRRTSGLIEKYNNIDNVDSVDNSPPSSLTNLGNEISPKGNENPTQPTQIKSNFAPNMPSVQPPKPNKSQNREAKKDIIKEIAVDNAQLANVLEQQESREQKQDLAERKFEQTKEIADKAERLKIHESFKDFDSELSTQAKAARNRLHAYETIEDSLKSGDLNPKKLSNFLANKYAGTQWEGIFSNSEREKVKAASIFMLDGLRDLFGGQLTDSKLQIASGKVVDPTKSEKQNQAIIDFRRFYDEAAVAEREIADQIVKENKGYRPIDYEAQVRQRLNDELAPEANRRMNLVLSDGLTSQDSVVMTAPNGNDYNVPTDQIDKYLAAGGKIKNG